MSVPERSFSGESTYVIEAENAAEMARLTTQDRLVTKAMSGLFPPQLHRNAVKTVLAVIFALPGIC